MMQEKALTSFALYDPFFHKDGSRTINDARS